jgi:hypothetical protein
VSERVEKLVEKVISELSSGNLARHGTPWVWPGEVYLDRAIRAALLEARREVWERAIEVAGAFEVKPLPTLVDADIRKAHNRALRIVKAELERLAGEEGTK